MSIVVSPSQFRRLAGEPVPVRRLRDPDGTELELAFDALCRAHGLCAGQWVKQYRFAPGRRYAFDRALVGLKVAVELDGGTWLSESGQRGRHTTGSGYASDCRKCNLAAALGWVVLRITREMLDEPQTWQHLEAVLQARAMTTKLEVGARP